MSNIVLGRQTGGDRLLASARLDNPSSLDCILHTTGIHSTVDKLTDLQKSMYPMEYQSLKRS